MAQYKVFKIKSNYISYYDNTKKVIAEVLVTNYGIERTLLPFHGQRHVQGLVLSKEWRKEI